MKIGIVYYSLTGNTKMLAEIACKQLQELSHKVTLLPISDYISDKEEKFDLLMIGSFCDSNNYPKKVRNLFSNLKQNKCLASFVTHSTFEEGPYYQAWAAGCQTFYGKYCKENNITDKGYFHCRSKPSPAISMFIRQQVIKDKSEWKMYEKEMNNYPGENEISHFKGFINTVIK